MAAVQGLQFPSIPEFGLLEEFLQPLWEDMVEQPVGGDWSLDSPSYDALSSSRSDVAKSPGKISHSPSSGGSAASHSPGGASRILTPASTSLLDLSDAAVLDDQNADLMSGSPGSNVSPTDGGFVHVSRDNARNRSAVLHSTRPPPTGRSGVWMSSTQPSHTSRESSVSQPTHGSGTPWSSYISSATVLMDDRQSGRQNTYHPNHDMIINPHGFHPNVPEDLLNNIGEFEGSIQTYQTPDGLPFRTLPDGSVLQPTYHAASVSSRALVPYPQLPADGRSTFGHTAHYQPFIADPYTPSINSQAQVGDFTSNLPYQTEAQDVSSSAHPHPSSFMYRNFTTGAASPSLVVPSNAPKVPVFRRSQASSADAPSRSPVEATPTVVQTRRNGSNTSSSRYQPLVRAGPSTSSIGAQRGSPGVTKTTRRGGRSKNSHLAEESRAKSHEMRKLGACWRCVMQRDPCDHGEPCSRCSLRSQKGQQYFFDCDRSKLPDFVHDFLPPSMTIMHQKQTIEDCVNTQVLEWDKSNGMDVYLNSGYGPALRWKVYEFKPRTEELLWQLQYFQDPATGQSTRHHKYSPPFGLLKIDTSDSEHFENYLNELTSHDHLVDFGWNCYEEESQVDEGCFQASVLDLMCKLYQNSTDAELKNILRDILRMLIITYIMGHTLTIVHDTLYTVISSVQHSARPSQIVPFTSPRLANRQLKFFFAVQRDTIYKNVLRWQQATLHQAGKKEGTWLSAFCVMLGFAMVLEEVQRTLLVQADAKADKGEMSPEGATREAYHACDRIDQRFKLLVGLFQCKYRDRKWGETGSFGANTPQLRDPHARDFLSRLRTLVETRQDHLRSRESVTFAPENQCLYTTRLTARFLLPFLSLPRA